MPSVETELYRSSNGDKWILVGEPGSKTALVRHQPNRSSGGQWSLMSVTDFLAEGHGPQHGALVRLIEAREEADR